MVTIKESRRYTVGKAIQARQVTKNMPFLLGSLVMVLVIGLVGFMGQMLQRDISTTTVLPAAVSSSSSSSSNSAVVDATYDRPGDNKPFMYQFDVVSQDLSLSTNNNGYTRKIPIIWNQIWEAAGWTPMKLMVSKYEANSKYREIVSLLETDNKISMPQRRHVYKYLAMADNGGGWLAHSDTFPLQPFGSPLSLPNDGKLTFYDENYPCLISGNASEWLRMGRRIAEHSQAFDAGNQEEEWTETLALKQMMMRDEENAAVRQNEVFEKEVDVTKPIVEGNSQWSWNTQDCQFTKEKRAVHFRLGEKEDLAGMHQPGDMVIKWLSMWLRICERSNHFINLENLKVEAEPAVVKVGTYHAPENYNETRAADSSSTTSINLSTLEFGGGGGTNNDDNTTISSEGETPSPPVVTGTFHVDENYAENRTQHNNNLRTMQEGGETMTKVGSYHTPDNYKEENRTDIIADSGTDDKASVLTTTSTTTAAAAIVDQPAVVVTTGTFHVDEKYNETKKTRRLSEETRTSYQDASKNLR